MVPMDQCHIDPVYKTIWLNAKQGNEFFTGSTDGTVSSKVGLKYQQNDNSKIYLSTVFP